MATQPHRICGTIHFTTPPLQHRAPQTPNNISRDTKDQTLQQHGTARFHVVVELVIMVMGKHATHAPTANPATATISMRHQQIHVRGHAIRDMLITIVRVMHVAQMNFMRTMAHAKRTSSVSQQHPMQPV